MWQTKIWWLKYSLSPEKTQQFYKVHHAPASDTPIVPMHLCKKKKMCFFLWLQPEKHVCQVQSESQVLLNENERSHHQLKIKNHPVAKQLPLCSMYELYKRRWPLNFYPKKMIRFSLFRYVLFFFSAHMGSLGTGNGSNHKTTKPRTVHPTRSSGISAKGTLKSFRMLQGFRANSGDLASRDIWLRHFRSNGSENCVLVPLVQHILSHIAAKVFLIFTERVSLLYWAYINWASLNFIKNT